MISITIIRSWDSWAGGLFARRSPVEQAPQGGPASGPRGLDAARPSQIQLGGVRVLEGTEPGGRLGQGDS